MRSHFIDLDCLLITDAKVCVVDKTNPSIPIMKISRSDFNLIRSGIYKSHGNSIKFSGEIYWIPTDMMNRIKIRAKVHKADASNLAFSMQEFMNKNFIEKLEYKINLDNILHLKNTNDHIYIICSKNNRKNYELIISKIEDKLKENGLVIKNFYYISETFYNRNSDDISNKKVRLLLQHSIGLKTDTDKFEDHEIEQYDEVFYYDDDQNSIKMAIDSNNLLMFLLSNTETSVKGKIKEDLKTKDHSITVNYVTGNKVNKFITTKVDIQFSNLIKLFENFIKRKF